MKSCGFTSFLVDINVGMIQKLVSDHLMVEDDGYTQRSVFDTLYRLRNIVNICLIHQIIELGKISISTGLK